MVNDRSELSASPAFIAILLTLIISLNPIKFILYTGTFVSLYVIFFVTKFDVKLSLCNMEQKATELLAALRSPNQTVEAKIGHLTSVKSDIKQKNVPEGAVPSIFESLRLSIASQHFSLLGAGFSTLGHFLKRLFIQEQHDLVSTQARHLYPLLLERLGDHKERVRAQAAQAFTDLWPAANADVEHYVLETALVGKNPKAREISMIWLSNMTRTHGLLFRAYVPSLVACLEDADSAVRETAKVTVVELFQNAPAKAKSDLKKQLAAHHVRKSITNVILTSIGLASADLELSTSRPASRAENLHHRPTSVMSSRSEHHGEVSKEDSLPASAKAMTVASRREQRRPSLSAVHNPSEEHPDSSATQRIPPESENLEPLIIASPRDLDEMVHDMLVHYEGRESEDNWVFRERNTFTLRRLARGNAPHDFLPQYLGAMKSLLDGIFKTVNSLRTTLSTNGCLVIQDLAKTCGPKIDPMVEIILQNLLKLCCGMKKITTQAGSITVEVVIDNVTYTPRILQHVSGACQDKNANLRIYASGWLKLVINKQARHKGSVEHNGNLDIFEKCIRKGLSDANPTAREAMRVTFWVFFSSFPDKANEILSSLDNKSRSLLEKASGNQKTDQPALKTKQTSKKPVAGGSSAATNRSALKEAIAAQRKARQSPQKALPPRPESAQSTFSEVKTSNTPPKPSAARAMATRPHISSLSSAPVRPAMKPRRPELARPATADPYASRRHAPIDPRSKPAGKIENSPNAMSKSVPTLKQTTGATQIRPRKDSVHGNTKSKPKKLDISKTRTHDPYAAASRSRSNSNESTMHPISEKVHLADTPIASEGPESPASVQLESPTAPAMQQPVFASDEIISHHSPPKHYEENTPPSTQGPVMGIDGSTPSGNVILNDAPKAADPVIIYEDPASSASADVDDGDDEATVVPDGRAARAGRAPDNGEQQLQGPVTITTPMPEHVTDGSALHPVPDSGRAPDTDPAKVEHHPGLSEFEEHESSMRPNIPPSPSNTVIHHRHRQTSMSSTLPQLADTNNNENTVSLSNKASNVPSDSRTSSKPNILGELHTNEPAHRDNKQPNGGLHRRHSSGKKFEPVRPPSDDAGRRHWRRIEQAAQRRSISPNSKDPKVAREMIRKALGRIRSDALDVVGFRKVQGLILHHDEMFTDEDLFDQLLMALLAAMERPPNEKRQPLGRPLDLKTQVLLTIRFMFTHNKKYFSAYYPRAMCGMVAARRNYEHGCHIVSGLEETVDDIAEVCKASEVMDAILDYAVTEERDEQGSRAITLGVFALNSILYHLHVVHTRIPNRLVVRVGGFCGDLLAGSRLDARRMVTMLCINLRGMVTEEKFWEVLGTLRDDSRNLLIYYLSRQ